MFKFWRFLNGPTLLFDAVDDGGGGGGEEYDSDQPTGEHPEFDVPDLGGADNNGARAGSATGNEDDAAGASGDKPAGKKSGQPPADVIPKHRLDAVIARERALQQRYAATDAEVKRLKALLAANLGIVDPNAPPSAKPLNDREKAIQARILELVPWLKDLQALAGNAEVLSGLAASAPDFDRQTKQYWNRVAATYMDSVDASIAPLILGEGKTAKDLTPQLRGRYRTDFLNWVQSDPDRVTRYESIDRTLVDDYRKELDDTFVAPVRRQYGADQVNRQKRTANLPVAGSSSAPVAGKKDTPKPVDEDAAADAAWKNLQERLAARA